MGQVSVFRAANRTCFCSSNTEQNGQLASNIRRACNFLTILYVCFTAAVICYGLDSLEQRIASLFLFCLMPAAGLCAGGHVLSHLMVRASKLCELIAVCCFRCLVLLLINFVNWLSPNVSEVSIRLLASLARCRLSNLSDLRHHCWRVRAAFIGFLCLLIRSGARFVIRVQASYTRWISDVRGRGWKVRPLMTGTLLAAFGIGWYASDAIWFPDIRRDDPAGGVAVEAVVERIIGVESNGDPNAKNKRSSATGLGQFLDETWLDLIQTQRPDLARGRSKDEILALRRDAKLAREITMRFTEQNAKMLTKRGLPVTPGTLYLAHFAGGAGAVAILSALDDADAASVMANADATGRTKREKIVKANSFLERFTAVDLRTWADRKMRVPTS
jgi:hypothetical protein